MSTFRSIRSRVPAACTLPTDQQPLRLAEFDELFSTAVLAVTEVDDTAIELTLRGDQEVTQTVRSLARRESECCSFFTFTVTTFEPDTIAAMIRVDSGHVDALRAIADRAVALSIARHPVGGEPVAGR